MNARWILASIVLPVATATAAQAIARKELLTSAGAGVGWVDIERAPDTLWNSSAVAGSFTFRFAYAITDRWSAGVHYDRIGTDLAGGGTELLRFTTYLLEGTYRPWMNERGAIEVYLAAGSSVMALTPESQQLPLRGRSNTVSIGARYVHRFGRTMGAFVSLDHCGANNMPVTDYNGNAIKDQDDIPISINWNSQRINAGLVVVF